MRKETEENHGIEETQMGGRLMECRELTLVFSEMMSHKVDFIFGNQHLGWNDGRVLRKLAARLS